MAGGGVNLVLIFAGRGAADVVEVNEAGYDNAPGQIS